MNKFKKRGFALATAVMAMALLLALSGLVATLVMMSGANSLRALNNFDSSLEVSRVATSFVEMSNSAFEEECLKNGFESAEVGFKSLEKSLELRLESAGGVETLIVVDTKKNMRLAKVQKTPEKVLLWTYQKEKIE